MTTIPRNAVALFAVAATVTFLATGLPVMSVAAAFPVGFLYAGFATLEP